MRTRWLGITAVLCVLGSAAAVLAVDAPHDGSATNGSCEACHKTHNSLGGTLMNQPDNNTACTTCHNDPTTSINQPRLGLPWIAEDQATPGKSGNQHRWDALTDAPAYGAQNPTDSGMLKRIKDGRLQCAVCHDPHADVKANDPNAQHVSMLPGVATAQTGGTAGAMTMTLTAPLAGAASKGYRLQVLRISGTTPEIGISHNARTLDYAPSWLVHNGTTWVAGSVAGSNLKYWASGAPVQLDDGTNVVVSFTGTAVVGQFWDFYISYAHLRASNVADAMCLQCHASRNQSHTTVEGPNLTGAVYSHPVGVTLNANGQGYDRAAGNVLDASGATQTVGDGNTTNNLTLVSGTTVSCTTCHNVHNADSNSLTADPR
jgi:predicted CXXCH cytochrome family protein